MKIPRELIKKSMNAKLIPATADQDPKGLAWHSMTWGHNIREPCKEVAKLDNTMLRTVENNYPNPKDEL